MALGELVGERLNAHAFGAKQHDEMVEKVSTLIDELLFRASDSFDHGLNGFLADLLGNLVDAFAEETRCVAVLRHLLFSLVDEILQLAEEFYGIAVVGIAPARVGAFVADGAVRIDFDQ